MKINVDYIARVEGEGSVKFEIQDGKLKNLKLNIWEPPRFFEGFLVGRKFDEVPDIVSRICGICPVSHMTTSIRAIEKALGFTPSLEIKNIRKIMSLSQIIASHLVHLYMLVLPDYHRLDMLFSRENPPSPPFTKGGKGGLLDEIKRLIRLKEAVNNVTALFGGRPLHPVAMIVGGFTKIPSRDEIEKIIKGLESIKIDALDTVKMLSKLHYPDFMNNVEYVSIISKDDYAVNEGTIVSSSGLRVEEDNYLSCFQEEEVPYSNAKKTVMKGRGSIMVGALSRLNIKFDMLHPEAKKAAGIIGFKTLERNPFLNNIAQAIEIVHGVWECIELLDTLSTEDSLIEVKVREGSGSALTEAPRGMLYHQYELNKRGVIEKANIVTPTAHNFMSLEESLKKLVNENIDKPKNELSLLCEMLVRAYDPCFSCSVH
ncbi:MAG: Ni/Fe hydrogenase subunit alpha [Nitrospirota bacterium]|nr:Ni/Fe hydrogenase subunit alpha [Nitrospirota bacterium]